MPSPRTRKYTESHRRFPHSVVNSPHSVVKFERRFQVHSFFRDTAAQCTPTRPRHTQASQSPYRQ